MIEQLKVEKNIANDSAIPWEEVSEMIGRSRGRQQCAAKWYRFSKFSAFRSAHRDLVSAVGRSCPGPNGTASLTSDEAGHR